MSRTSWSGGFRVEKRPRNWQANDWKAENRTCRTVLVEIPYGTYQKCRSKRTKRMVPYGGTKNPVRFSGMWKTHVGTKSRYGICMKSPVRWFVKYRTVCEDVENVRCLLEARTVLQEEVASGWVRNTVRCIWEKYPVRCLSKS